MKHSCYVLIALAFLLVFLAGCQEKIQNTEEPQPEIAAEIRTVNPVDSDSLDTANMTMLREFSTDLDLDNIEEKIELYTAAERGENGEIVWDDGQNWLLLVRDEDKAYSILSQYVQLGSVYFAVSKSGEDQMPNITVMIPTGARFSMIGYTYNKEEDSFNGKLLYEAEDDNWLYSSLPGY
jgi:hypothetical protein